MLALVVARGGAPRWRTTYELAEVTIGHDEDNQLVLDEDEADECHARIVVRGGKVIVADLQSARGTFVGGKRLVSPAVIGPLDPIAIGAYTLNAFLVAPEPLTAYPIRSLVERELLKEIEAGDDASLLVYADWLERQGDPARAELLRLQHALDSASPDAPGFERATDRLRELAAHVDLGWRSRIASCPIEGCAKPDASCPKRWSALPRTDREGVRRCGACDRGVYYCGSVFEARAHVAHGAGVAIDVTSARWHDDLSAPYGRYVCERCRIDLGWGFDRCPRCEGELERVLEQFLRRRQLDQYKLREYEGSVARYFRHKVSPAAQRDLVQRTFLAAIELGASAAGTTSLRANLFHAAHQTLRAYRLAEHLDAHEPGPEPYTLDAPDEALARRQEHRLLLAALRRLPLRSQTVLELHYWENLRCSQIAELLGVPLATSRTWLRDARLQLRHELLRRDVPPELQPPPTDTFDRWVQDVRERLRGLEGGWLWVDGYMADE
jgi:RNA polymerase sigma factor (sigma-70 family)